MRSTLDERGARAAARPRCAVVLDGRQDPAALGGKGAALDRLIGWGLPVPGSGAVTVDAYRRFAAQAGIASLVASLHDGTRFDADEVDRVVAGVPFPDEVAAEVLAVARAVAGEHRLAVRSSATVEDLAHSSFAGQYHSELDVDPTDDDAVLAAVRAVFASLWHPAPCAYRRNLGIDDSDAAMAAVLMAMVPARRAGVVFTVDPAGRPSAARIEAVGGLGEALVSGATTPDAWVVPRAPDRRGLDPELEEALALSLRIEEATGAPQDVEWAWDGDQVWIVQARPITTVAHDGDGFDDPEDALEDLDLTTAGIGEMLPGVLPPLLWGIDSHLVQEAFGRLLDDLGLLTPEVDDHPLLRRVRGRAAMDFSRLSGMAAALPGSVAAELESQYFGSRRRGRAAAPVGRRSHGRLRTALHDLRVLRSRNRYATEAALSVATAQQIGRERVDLSTLTVGQLLRRQLLLLDLLARGMAAELGLAADGTATYRRLEVLLSRHVPPGEAGRLADQAVARVGLTAPFDQGSSRAVVGGPTWEEQGRTPPSTLGGGASHRGAGVDAVLDALDRSPGWDRSSVLAPLRRRSIRRLAGETSARLAAREETKAALLALGGELRRTHLEAGRRLTEARLLSAPEEVDLLDPRELRSALVTGEAVSPAELGHRRRWRDRNEQEGPLPARFTGRPPPPGPPPSGDDHRLEGWAASGGRHRGRVQVVRSPDETIEAGAVLVAEATDPSWSPLFLRAGALVLDRGGPLSHAAILARELELPAVLNVPGATVRLEGREVTVDGDAGLVVVHGEDPP